MAMRGCAKAKAAGSHPHLITLLPAEILGTIFNKLKKKEVLQLRLVSNRWNEVIKESYNFRIVLNEDSPGLEFILQLRIQKLEVKKLVQNRIQTLPVEAAPAYGQVLRPQAKLTKLAFKYPKTIRWIAIKPLASISSENLKELLQLCQNTITLLYLELNRKSDILKHVFQSPISFNFQKLRRLDLKLKFMDGVFQENTILSQLKISHFPKLAFLNVIEADYDYVTETTPSPFMFILKLLAKNPKGLKSVIIDSESGRFYEAIPSMGLKNLTAELASLKSITNLKHLRYDVEMEDWVASTNMDPLLQLISRQRKLKTFFADYVFKATLLRTIILNNQEVLVSLEISDLHLNGQPFDVSVLKNCPKLKKLFLIKYFPERLDSGPELINSDGFPTTLQDLSLHDFRVLSSDIASLLDSDLMLTLGNLTLRYCGDSGVFGLNCAGLEKVEKLTKLKTGKFQMIVLQGYNWDNEYSKMVSIYLRLKNGIINEDRPGICNDGIILVRDRNNPDSGLVSVKNQKVVESGNDRHSTDWENHFSSDSDSE